MFFEKVEWCRSMFYRVLISLKNLSFQIQTETFFCHSQICIFSPTVGNNMGQLGGGQYLYRPGWIFAYIIIVVRAIYVYQANTFLILRTFLFTSLMG